MGRTRALGRPWVIGRPWAIDRAPAMGPAWAIDCTGAMGPAWAIDRTGAIGLPGWSADRDDLAHRYLGRRLHDFDRAATSLGLAGDEGAANY